MLEHNNVIAALAEIPQFSGTQPDRFKIERLGGLTNLVFRVRVGTDDYLLRLPGKGTEEYIDRSDEERAARIAADAGVSAQVHYFNANNGVMLAEYIAGDTLNAERFKNIGSVQRSAIALRRMHDCPQPFAKTFDVFEQIDDYLALLEKLDAKLPDGYAQVKSDADRIRVALQKNPAPLAPSHCDPLAENFIDTGKQVYIVDWEYAGNNDPMWDLGDLSVEAEFDTAQDTALLDAYFNGSPPAEQVARMQMYKALCDLLWTLWGVVQHANDNPAEDFWAYATGRFERCKCLIQSPEFARQLAVLEH